MTDELQVPVQAHPDADPETESASSAPDEVEQAVAAARTQRVSFGDWLRGLFGVDVATENRVRLANLSAAIDQYPEAPANYLLRADLYMAMRRYADAADDYQQAYDLAEAEFERGEWGMLAGSVRERAREGLVKAGRKLKR
ncbi:MAG: hypothetical protein AAFV33_00835 [Chloroflexota bacterium]